MKKSTGNYLKVTIYKAKILSESMINSYTLKMDFCKQSCETDKIPAKDFEMGGKVKYFNYLRVIFLIYLQE
jgi:hypothetical protein